MARALHKCTLQCRTSYDARTRPQANLVFKILIYVIALNSFVSLIIKRTFVSDMNFSKAANLCCHPIYHGHYICMHINIIVMNRCEFLNLLLYKVTSKIYIQGEVLHTRTSVISTKWCFREL